MRIIYAISFVLLFAGHNYGQELKRVITETHLNFGVSKSPVFAKYAGLVKNEFRPSITSGLSVHFNKGFSPEIGVAINYFSFKHTYQWQTTDPFDSHSHYYKNTYNNRIIGLTIPILLRHEFGKLIIKYGLKTSFGIYRHSYQTYNQTDETYSNNITNCYNDYPVKFFNRIDFAPNINLGYFLLEKLFLNIDAHQGVRKMNWNDSFGYVTQITAGLGYRF